jgi:hypothetical protein
MDRFVKEVGWLSGKYINCFLKIGLSILIGSSYIAKILNVNMWCKDILYILFKMIMEDKLYCINFELGV